MYPTEWRRFLTNFETETSRPYGKVIIDNNSTVLQRMEARQEMQHPYINAVQNKQEEMQRLLQTPSLMTESEKAMKYNQMMNDIIAYKKQVQPQVVL